MSASESSVPSLGFIGLGDMGGPMAANVAKAGFPLRVFDKAGTDDRAPAGSTPGDSTVDLAARCETIFLSVPDGKISRSIAEEIIAAPNRVATTVIDLSTTGVQWSKDIGELLSNAGLTYIDAPVSGGRAGAVAGTITVIWGGPGEVLETHRPAVEALSGNIFHVGDEPGFGQTVKLLNNFLSATSMAATSEAIAFGVSQGIDMKTMLDVVHVSSGQNTAISEKFPNRVLTETYDAGFRSALMRKDVNLYLESVNEAGTKNTVGRLISDIWDEVDDARPGSDLTEIYKHTTEK